MKPTSLDESLLTAYLDNELTDDERRLVEDQLQRDERWRTLLAELESIRNRLQELTTPTLSRSLAEGPWKSVGALSADPSLRAGQTLNDTQRSRKSLWALAASFAILAVGIYAWIKLDKQTAELAQQTSPSNEPAEDFARDEAWVAPPPQPIDGYLGSGSTFDDLRMMRIEKGQGAASLPPMATAAPASAAGIAAPPAPLSDDAETPPRRAILPLPHPTPQLSSPDRFLSESQTVADPLHRDKKTDPISIPIPTPAITYYGRLADAKEFTEHESQRERSTLANETKRTGTATPLATAETEPKIAAMKSIPSRKYIWRNQAFVPVDNSALLGLIAETLSAPPDPNQRYELFFPQADFSEVQQTLRSWGVELAPELRPTLSLEQIPEPANRDNDNSREDVQPSMRRPPRLIGAIEENASTESWAMIVIEPKR